MTDDTPSIAMPDQLSVFVYGTLKSGFENHEHYCRGASMVAHGRTWGRLYLKHANIPVLEVPALTVVLRGSADYAEDLAGQQELIDDPPPIDWASYRPSRGWRMIEGELLRFPDPLERLGILDAVEGFLPRTPDGYERVLLPMQIGEDASSSYELVWTYALPAGEVPPGKPLNVSEWQTG